MLTHRINYLPQSMSFEKVSTKFQIQALLHAVPYTHRVKWFALTVRPYLKNSYNSRLAQQLNGNS